jgi:hypothetical protein
MAAYGSSTKASARVTLRKLKLVRSSPASMRVTGVFLVIMIAFLGSMRAQVRRPHEHRFLLVIVDGTKSVRHKGEHPRGAYYAAGGGYA